MMYKIVATDPKIFETITARSFLRKPYCNVNTALKMLIVIQNN